MTSKLQHRTGTGRQAALISIAILLLAGLCSGQPAVSLSPKDGPPTTTLRVSGSGFTPHAQIDIYFDSQDQALAVADSAGAFSQVAIQAPKSAVPGNHWVTAAERSGRIVRQEIFEVHVNWTDLHTKDMRRFNPYENVLNVNNVGSLHLKGSYSTGDYVHSSPAVVNGVVYAGSFDGYMYALNARSGALLWSYPTGGWIHSSPAVANGVVYIGSDDGNLYALDAGTGTLLWSYFTGWHEVESSPTVADGVVYMGSSGGNLYALDASSGTLLWNSPTYDEFSTPAVANGTVYVGSLNSYVYALNATTGTVVWSYRTGGDVDASPAVANGVVYVGSLDYSVYALDAGTGVKLWSYPTGFWILSSPAVAHGVVYVGSSDGNLYALAASTGALLWSYPRGGGANVLWSSPAVANGVVYVGGPELYALDARTGAKLWSYNAVGYEESSPAVANGVVYVGSDNGKVYAFGLPKELAPQPPRRPDPKTFRPDFSLKPVSTTD